MSETSSRLLTLLSLLQARAEWSGADLAERLEVSRRTVRRDVDRLRRLGYPVESATGPAGCYRMRSGTAMPPLLLDDDEAVAIGVGLSTAARAAVEGIDEAALRALVKLEQVLPKRLQPRLRALATATSTAAMPPGPTVDAEVLTLAAAACRDHERLRFAYSSRDGTESRREVEPHSLVNLGRRWYLLAWDPDRDDWRTFRLDRMSRSTLTAVRFEPRRLPHRDPARFVERNLSSAPSRYEARVIVHAPADEVLGRSFGGWGRVTPIDDRSCELHTGDDDLDWLALRIGAIGFEAEIVGPPELKQHVADFAARLARTAAS